MPENLIKYCIECVISNQRPSSVVEFKNKLEDIKPKIQFTEGVCSACIWEKEKSKIDWSHRREELEILMISILEDDFTAEQEEDFKILLKETSYVKKEFENFKNIEEKIIKNYETVFNDSSYEKKNSKFNQSKYRKS